MAEKTAIVTRFAPSPTGYLHIGGARTALFNWLYARGPEAGPGSKFLLRIEDTDRARHDEAAVTAILDGLKWMGLDWDGAPVSQFARKDRHAEVANDLLARGGAYRCWLAGEELERAKADAKERGVRFTSPWRERTGEGEGPYSVRLKAPLDGETVIADRVQGEVRFPNDALDDMVLLRSDGTPTYTLAVVVDDHDMDVTHIIRGDDHLINGARQTHLYEALGWPVPVFAHIPLIHGTDGKKLSKRHGALGVESYADDGYIPEGLMNGLLRLGWSHGNDEIITKEQALSWFGLEGIGKAPARLDPAKLTSTNGHHIDRMADRDFAAAALPFLGFEPNDAQRDRLIRGAGVVKERCRLLTDVPDAAGFLLAERPLEITGKAAKPLRKDGAADALRDVAARLADVGDWTEANIGAALDATAEETGRGFGQIGPPVRAAVTGGRAAPELPKTLYVIGKEEVLARLADWI